MPSDAAQQSPARTAGVPQPRSANATGAAEAPQSAGQTGQASRGGAATPVGATAPTGANLPAGGTSPAGGSSGAGATDPSSAAMPAADRPVDRSGITALSAALRSMTAPRMIVPTAQKAPSGRRIATLAAWAAVLGLVGALLALRGVIIILANHPPTWFKPALGGCGLAGIVLTAGGFVTARRGGLPWIFLGAATAALIASVVVVLDA